MSITLSDALEYCETIAVDEPEPCPVCGKLDCQSPFCERVVDESPDMVRLNSIFRKMYG